MTKKTKLLNLWHDTEKQRLIVKNVNYTTIVERNRQFLVKLTMQILFPYTNFINIINPRRRITCKHIHNTTVLKFQASEKCNCAWGWITKPEHYLFAEFKG